MSKAEALRFMRMHDGRQIAVNRASDKAPDSHLGWPALSGCASQRGTEGYIQSDDEIFWTDQPFRGAVDLAPGPGFIRAISGGARRSDRAGILRADAFASNRRRKRAGALFGAGTGSARDRSAPKALGGNGQ